MYYKPAYAQNPIPLSNSRTSLRSSLKVKGWSRRGDVWLDESLKVWRSRRGDVFVEESQTLGLLAPTEQSTMSFRGEVWAEELQCKMATAQFTSLLFFLSINLPGGRTPGCRDASYRAVSLSKTGNIFVVIEYRGPRLQDDAIGRDSFGIRKEGLLEGDFSASAGVVDRCESSSWTETSAAQGGEGLTTSCGTTAEAEICCWAAGGGVDGICCWCWATSPSCGTTAEAEICCWAAGGGEDGICCWCWATSPSRILPKKASNSLFLLRFFEIRPRTTSAIAGRSKARARTWLRGTVNPYCSAWEDCPIA